MRPIIGISCARSEETGYTNATGRIFDYAQRPYQTKLFDAGAVPVLIPSMLDEKVTDEYIDDLLSQVDGLYFTGGGGVIGRKPGEVIPALYEQQPIRAAWEDRLLKRAYEKDIPCLGVCRGYQMMAIAFGGAMDEVRYPEHKQPDSYDVGIHNVSIAPGSVLEAAVGGDDWLVNSIHIERVKKVPDGFVCTAEVEGGFCEAIEAVGKRFFMGTQFHPELMPCDPRSIKFFEAFIRACQK